MCDNSMTSSEISLPHSQSRRRDLFALVAVFLLVGLTALAFAWPWRPATVTAGSTLERYVPVRDGTSSLSVKYDASGEPLTWTGQNATVLPSARALADGLRPAVRSSVVDFYPDIADTARIPGGGQFVEHRIRELQTDGTLEETQSLAIREARGDFLVGWYVVADDRDLAFSPPALTLPAHLETDTTWASEGRLADLLDYRLTGRVVAVGPFEAALDAFEDCVQVETRFVLSNGGSVQSDETYYDWYCAGVGAVASQRIDANGDLLDRTDVVATSEYPGYAADAVAPPTTPSLDPAGVPATGDLNDWQVQRLGRSRASGYATESTIPPVWIPTNPPLVLAAAHFGDLVAFDATDAGTIRWRFHPGGTVYGEPAFDPARGRIYFGASDKRLYALDANGLYQWSFQAGDNVTGRPALLADTVVFGSEDRRVYALDAETGVLQWAFDTAGPIVSSPAVAGDLVVIGSDDGGVYALDAATGEERWLVATEDAVEAPIVTAGDVSVVYAASRDGTLYALDVATGEERWAGDAGAPLRTAPVPAGGRVYVVDTFGRLLAFDDRDGRRIWATVEYDFVGPPAMVGDTLVVAGSDGIIYRLDAAGVRQGHWSSSGALSPTDSSTVSYKLGPTAGGDALWLADSDGVVRRLGPATADTAAVAASLQLIWADSVINTPFRESFLWNSVAAYRDSALVIDIDGSVYLIEPATGEGVRTGAIDLGEATLGAQDPIVAGDLVLVVVGETLRALRLPTAQPAWSFSGAGESVRPAVVAGDTVLWVTAEESMNESVAGAGTLHALDLADGSVRWEAPLRGLAAPGGIAVRDGTVYLSTPPAAFDLETGEQRWQANTGLALFGGPAFSAAGDTLYVAALDTTTNGGIVLAYHTTTGAERWRAETPDDVLNLFDRLWVSGDTLIVPGLSGGVLALDAGTGEERWHYTPDHPRLGTATVDAGRVWLVLQNGHLLALDAATGEVVAGFTELDMDLSSASRLQRPVRIGDTLVTPLGVMLLGFGIE